MYDINLDINMILILFLVQMRNYFNTDFILQIFTALTLSIENYTNKLVMVKLYLLHKTIQS